MELTTKFDKSNVCKPFFHCIATANIPSWINGIGTFKLAHLFSLHFGRFRQSEDPLRDSKSGLKDDICDSAKRLVTAE